MEKVIYLIVLLLHLANAVPNAPRRHQNILGDYLLPQPSPESLELAKAVCKVGCLQDCLHTLQTKSSKDSVAELALEELRKTPVNVQSECRRLSPAYLFYTECEEACDTGLAYNDCARKCASGELPDGWACHTGCRKLDTALKSHFGDCPPDIKTKKTVKAPRDRQWMSLSDDGIHIPACTHDLDCPGDKKCCSGLCVNPVFGDDVPEAVLPPQITEQNNPRSFELIWSTGRYDGVSSDKPVIYVLQVRTYFGPEFDPMTADAWKTLTMTSIPGARLSEPDVGWWYQYRIAAVSLFGSRGFADSTTPPVHVTSQLPQAASAPRNLVDGVWRFQADGGVHVRIEWKPPATAVIPVTEYRISWFPGDSHFEKRGTFEDKMAPFLHIVPASQTQYLLRDLKTNMSYTIQVQAISSWGPKTFISEPATHFIITPSLPKREPYFQNQRSSDDDTAGGLNQDRHGQVSCSCENSVTHRGGKRLQISSNFRPLRLSQPLDKVSIIRFANDPGVSDGQHLKTVLTVNEFAQTGGEAISPRLLTIQWKQRACIETGAQISKTFMPLKPLNEFGLEKGENENSRFVVLEPVPQQDQAPLLPEGRLIRTGRVEISSLQLNCHYAVYISAHKRKSSAPEVSQMVAEQTQVLIGCLCTPACFDDQSIPWASHFSCSDKESDVLSPPTNLRSRLISESSIVYNMSWKPPNPPRATRSPRSDFSPGLNYSQIFYRATWGPAMDRHLNPQTLRLMADPSPRLSPSESQTKVLPSANTSFLLESLHSNSLYIFKIQSILLRTQKHSDNQDGENVPEILQASHEAYIYVQTPTRNSSFGTIAENGASGVFRSSLLGLALILPWPLLFPR